MIRATLLVLMLLAIATLGGCSHQREASAPRVLRVEPIRGNPDRAVLRVASDDKLGAAREAIIDAGERGVVYIELHDAKQSTLLELPTTRSLDVARRFVVVRIDATARYGTTSVADTAALEAAARRDAAPAPVVLLRVADDITFEQIVAATKALNRASITQVVLGLLRPGVAPPEDGWLSCPFPPGAEEGARGIATLSIDWDDEGRPGAVRVLESSGDGFGGAALICALSQRSSSSRCSGSPPCTQRLKVKFAR